MEITYAISVYPLQSIKHKFRYSQVINDNQLISFSYINGSMKIIAFILIFLVAGSTFIPCADLDADQSINTELFSDVAQDGNFDLCSPFCSCHCCHSHVVPSFLSFDFKNFPLPEVLSFYRTSIMEQAIPYWQPPKIS